MKNISLALFIWPLIQHTWPRVSFVSSPVSLLLCKMVSEECFGTGLREEGHTPHPGTGTALSSDRRAQHCLKKIYAKIITDFCMDLTIKAGDSFLTRTHFLIPFIAIGSCIFSTSGGSELFNLINALNTK